MKAIRVYQYPNCSTCKKALKFLQAKKVAFDSVDIVETPPSKGEIERMLEQVGDLKRLFNTSGQLYRELKISEKLPKLSESEAVALLAKHGKLIKRPFVPEHGLVGFKEDEWKRAFAK